MGRETAAVKPRYSAQESMWTEIHCYTVYKFAAMVDIPPQIAANKQWRYIAIRLRCHTTVVHFQVF
jgi:hypothetical protein